jgi:hypothetical protein
LYSRGQQAAGYGNELTPDQIAAQSELGKWASGENMNPLLGVNNPYLEGVINNSSQDVMRNLMPMINKANAASGSFGNSGVAETYGRTAADQLGQIATNTRYQDYTRQQGLFENDANRRIAALQPFLGQANLEQQLPWQNLKNYRDVITAGNGGSTSTPYFTNTTSNVLGGVGVGSWIGNQLLGGG